MGEPGDAPINPEIFYKKLPGLKIFFTGQHGKEGVLPPVWNLFFCTEGAYTSRCGPRMWHDLAPPNKRPLHISLRRRRTSHVRVGGGRWIIACGVCWRGMPSRRDLWANVKKTQRFVGSLIERGWRR